MNCGPATGDPRTWAERKLLCGDCLIVEPPARTSQDELLEALVELVRAVTRTDMLTAKEQWYWPEVQRAKAAIKAARKGNHD